MKLWIVTAVDYGDSCDGKARVLGAFKNYDEAKNYVDEAKNYVDEDIKEWIDMRAGEGCECDFNKMAVWSDCDDSIRCEWNIEDVEIAVVLFAANGISRTSRSKGENLSDIRV